MSKKIDGAVERIRDAIDFECAPERMSLAEYDELLDALGSEIESRVDCRREEREFSDA